LSRGDAGGGIVAALVQSCTTGRCKVLGAVAADVVLRRPQAVPIRGGLEASGIDRNEVAIDAADSGLDQQLLNDQSRSSTHVPSVEGAKRRARDVACEPGASRKAVLDQPERMNSPSGSSSTKWSASPER
jgi:hypothetical protein